MKKILTLFAVLMLLPLQACSNEKWQEGTHYITLAGDKTEKPVVAEFFSFWCPHCFSFEPVIAKLKEQLPVGTEFDKVHVNFMRFASSDTQDAATRAMMVGRAMNKEAQINQAIFRYIHVQRAPITNLNDLRNLYIVNGIDGEEFDKLASSFNVNSMVKKNNQEVEKFQKHIRGVPTVIVNGKYMAQIAKGMTNDDFIELVLWLTTKP